MSGNEQQQQTAADASNDRTNQGDSIGDLAPSHEESVGVKGGGYKWARGMAAAAAPERASSCCRCSQSGMLAKGIKEMMSSSESDPSATAAEVDTIEDLAPADADAVKGGFNPQPEPPGKPASHQ